MREYISHYCVSCQSVMEIRRLALDLTREYASNGASRIVLSTICHRYDVGVVDALRILAAAQSLVEWRRIPLVDDGRYGAMFQERPWQEDKRIVSRQEIDFLLHGF